MQTIPRDFTGLVSPVCPRQAEGHLIRLLPDTRKLRFGSMVNDDALCRHIATLERDGSLLIGFRIDGTIRGLAELRFFDGEELAEAAFSVEEQWQGQRIGSALMGRVVLEAALRAATAVYVVCSAHNRRMLAICRRAGGELTCEDGDCTARIDVAATARRLDACGRIDDGGDGA